MNRYKSVKIASIFGMIGNIFLLIIKGTIGVITQSQAMLADAFNSFGDVLTSFVTFIGNKIASKPFDDDHNLGHGKAEYIYSMIISLMMIVTSTIVIKNAVESIINRDSFNYSPYLIVVCVVTILVKLSLYIYTSKISKKLNNNLLLKANSKDHRNDCVITTCSLFSCIMNRFGIYFLDGLVGSLIASWIFLEAIKIFKESYDVLMDKSISDETKKRVLNIIKDHDEIKKITHFNSTPVGYRYQISFSIFVDGNLSTFDSHKIADDLEKEITNSIEEIYLTVIHVNPI